MGMALRVAALGKGLRLMAQEISPDLNENYYLAHAALTRIIEDNPSFTDGEPSPHEMRAALWAADLEGRTSAARSHAPRWPATVLEAPA